MAIGAAGPASAVGLGVRVNVNAGGQIPDINVHVNGRVDSSSVDMDVHVHLLVALGRRLDGSAEPALIFTRGAMYHVVERYGHLVRLLERRAGQQPKSAHAASQEASTEGVAFCRVRAFV